jgi:hypothetical protein
MDTPFLYHVRIFWYRERFGAGFYNRRLLDRIYAL